MLEQEVKDVEASRSPSPADDPDVHLAHLLTPGSLETPWYKTFVQNVRDAIHPPKLPPLEVTSKPLEVGEFWGFYGGNEKKAGVYSILIHIAVIVLIFWIGSLKPVRKMISEVTPLFAPDLKPYLPEQPKQMHGGGGGGTQSPLEASKGKLPKIAPRQFTPPRVDPPEHPKLPMVPTIVSEVAPPNIEAPNYGDPLSRMGIPSNGTGMGGGIGSGIGGGVGSGRGPGTGPGSGGGFGGGAYRIGGGVSPPSVLSKVEPEYSEEARKAKWQGTVVLQLVVDEHGLPQQMHITRSLGLGLDQKALEAVGKWRFKPGMKDGKPVPVIATIEVNFRLL
ncbi:MAG TPA: energy transducer TonB [Bryobacteraceae bacterium]|nr:energy transducer TonB [Bryobacteraceae bacterium]